MSPDPVTPVESPPIAKKVFVGLLGYAVALVAQLVIPGYSPDPIVQQLIDGAVGFGASFLVREELRYLVPALKAAEKYQK